MDAIPSSLLPPSSPNSAGGQNSSLSNVMNWYEMTETSRCSEGDESIADFSICHPNPSSATNALALAVGAKPTLKNVVNTSAHSKSSPLPHAEQDDRPLRTSTEKIGPNSSNGTVGNSSSYKRATSFAGAFSLLSTEGK